MPEIRPHHNPAGVMTTPPAPRTGLFWSGTYWRSGIVDAAGRLQVRGEDQLFSVLIDIAIEYAGVISGAGGWYESAGPIANRYWVLTNIMCRDITSACTRMRMSVFRAANPIYIHEQIRAFVAGDFTQWSGQVILRTGDTIRCYFPGALAGDICQVYLCGYQMTVET